MEKILSVIIPVHNAQAYLNSCIDSVLKQSYVDLEVILVNDHSTDNSLQICLDYQTKDGRVKVINIDTERRGPSYARNIGLDAVSGDFFAFIDADDYIDREMYEKLMHKMSDDFDMAFCQSNNVYSDGKISECKEIGIQQYVLNKDMQCLLAENDIQCRGVVWRTVFRKEMLGALRFDERMKRAEDTVYLLRCFAKARKCTYIEDYLYYYRISDYYKKYYDTNYIADTKLFIQCEIETLNSLSLNSYIDNVLFCWYKNLILSIYVARQENAKILIKQINNDTFWAEAGSRKNYKKYLSFKPRKKEKLKAFLVAHKFYGIIRFLCFIKG